MSYEGYLKDFLGEANISIGDIIKVTNSKTSYKGMLLDKPDYSTGNTLVLKLDSGYNIGVDIKDAVIDLIKKEDKPSIKLDPIDKQFNDDKMNISILSTGGTVASVIDYKTGAVHPAFTADDLLRVTPELVDHANITGEAIFNILSENMNPDYWIKTARSIYDQIDNGADGIVLAHGTDTMHYTASVLSFILRTPVPIVLTGAQRSSDRPSSDAFLNLMGSVTSSKSDIAEVTVCMHSTINDDACMLHRGNKVRKMHTSRRDTFTSINTQPLAEIKNEKITMNPTIKYTSRNENKLELFDQLESKVALIKIYPGITSEIIETYIDKGYKGLILEGTGLGHCSIDIMDSIKRACDEDMVVIMTSQCLYGHTNLNVYSNGRKLLDCGVMSIGDILPETAYTKLMWACGQTTNTNEIKMIMQENIANETSNTLSLENFPKKI
ncbi:MAG: Glu-tRNA(Gln) amidotransferase subunit GatD [Methanobacteriaceae archaeon]|nr:Glu-tRNA(Gln) amidotransferase subunit GatD [Methanobacteriaceae archaeon]